MSEATKGSDVRAACEADLQVAKDFCIHIDFGKRIRCAMEPADYEKFLNQLATEIAARVQAAAVEMRERCAVFVQDNEGHDPICPWYYSPDDNHVVNCTCEAKELADKVCALPIPTNAYDAALLRARIETAEITLGWDKMQFLNQVAEWKRQLADLTQHAPERKEK